MESDTELGSTPVVATEATIAGQDRLADDSIDQQDASEHGVGKKRKVFPYHITNELRSLYKAGMIGVGVQYSSLIEAACDRTGLSKSQVKVKEKSIQLLSMEARGLHVHGLLCTVRGL